MAVIKNYKLEIRNFIFIALFLFLTPSISLAEKATISREGLIFHNINLSAEFNERTQKDVYQPTESININVGLRNMGKYCLLDGTLIYSLTAGQAVPNLPPNATTSDVDSENVINEGVLPIVSCPGQSTDIPVKIDLPKDLKAGNYRVDFYLKSPRTALGGNHETYRPGAYLPFRVSGSGDFPSAKIVRSKSSFAGAFYQIGPVIKEDSKQTSFVTIINENNKPFNGRLITTICPFGEQSGLGCEDIGDQDVLLAPSASETFEKSIYINFKPDVYSIYHRLVDTDDRIHSNYKNRFIIRGHQASIRGLSVNKLNYKEGDRVNIQTSINGPYTFGESQFTVEDIDFKIEFFDRSGIFEKKIFIEKKNFPEVTSNSEVGFFQSFLAGVNITGYKLCGTLIGNGGLLDKRCVFGGQDNVIFSWPTFDIFATGLILLIFVFLWRKVSSMHKKLVVSHIILLLSFVVGATIILYSGESITWAGVADQFQSTLPGDDRFVNPAVTQLEKCSYINFYYDKNGDDTAQASEKINLYRGGDDGLYYVPKNTIAYLFRPVFDDPNATVIYNGKPHVLPVGSPFMDCVDPIYGASCANGDGVGAAYFPVYLMDVVKSVQGSEAPTFTSVTTHDINVTAQQLLDAINTNTYSDPLLTTHTTISPALTTADVPNLTTLNNGSDLNLFDSYFGMSQVQPPPYEEAKILTNYETRCEMYDPQANATLLNLFASVKSPNRIQSPLASTKNNLLASLFSLFDFKILNKSGLLAAVGMSVTTNTVSVGTGPTSVATGDLDNDNDQDIVTANLGSGTLSIITQDGVNSGVFTNRNPITSITSAFSVAIGDLNNDSFQDIVAIKNIANGSNPTAMIYAGNGSGTSFTGPVTPQPATGGSGAKGFPSHVIIADMNGDEKRDLIIVNNYNAGALNYVSILPNTTAVLGGTISFGAPVDVPTSTSGAGRPYEVVAAYLDGDSRLDMVVTNNATDKVSVFLTNSQPFPSFARTDYATGDAPWGVVLNDFNNDGTYDIAVANNGTATVNGVSPNTVSVFLNNGNSTFANQVPYAVGLRPKSIASSDVSGDGKPDIITANNGAGANSVSVLKQVTTSPGTFESAVNYTVGTAPYFVATADLNGYYQQSDIVTANYSSNNVSISLVSINLGPGTPGAPTVTAGNGQVSITGWTAPTTGTTPVGYRIYGSANGSPYTKIGNDIPAPPTFPIFIGAPTITNGTSYTFKVSAYEADGTEGSQSPASSPVAIPQYPPLPLGAPSGVAGSGEVTVNWTPPVPASDSTHGPADGYFIYSKVAIDPDTSYAKFNTTPITTGTSGIVNNLTNGTAYVFKVTANNIGGESLLADSIASVPVTPTPPPCITPPSNLISWWPGDGNANDIYSLNNGTLNGGAIATASGKVEQAFSFDNFNTYVSHQTNGISPTAGTVEMWVKPNWSGNDSANHGLWQTKNDDTTNQANWISLFKSSNNNLYFRIMTPAGAFTNDLAISAGTLFTPGVWTHVAATWDSSATKIYINGTERASKTSPILPTSLDGFARIGRSVSGSFNGVIDEVSIYNRALTINEIQSIYSVDSSGKCKPIPTSPPTSLTATPGNTEVALSWTAPTGTITGYKVYRDTTSNFNLGTPIATLANTDTSYLDTGRTNGVNYYYKVTATNAGVDSIASNEVSAIPTIQCLVNVNLNSTSQTEVVVNGTSYYIDIDGVRGYLWNNGLITSSTQNTYNYPAGSAPKATGVLQYKVTESGFYDLFIKEDQAARSAWFEGRPVAPDSFDGLFGDREPI